MRRVILVTGPPCAGKSTYVAQHAQLGDLILDQDALGARRMTAALAHIATMADGTAWVIRCAPGPTARRALARRIHATELVHLVQPEPTLVQRAARRPHPRRHIAAVAQWFTRERADQTRSKQGHSKRGTTARGYGTAHQHARRDALAQLQDGQGCTRCGRPMWRAEAQQLDLDHNTDRTGYLGLAHRTCNRRAGQTRSAQARRVRTQPATPRPSSTRSRNW